MTGLFSSAYYCEFPCDSLIRHHCKVTCKNCLPRLACISDWNTNLNSSESNKTFDNLRCYGPHKLNNVCKESNYAFIAVYVGKNITANKRFRATLMVHISARYGPNSKLKTTSAMSLNSNLQTKANMLTNISA